jgi:hypothetical protein
MAITSLFLADGQLTLLIMLMGRSMFGLSIGG